MAVRNSGTSEQRRQLLKQLLASQQASEQQFPTSYAQQRLWLLQQLTPDSLAYHMPAALRIRGPLDPACVKRVLDEIVRRHESLRTRFRETNDGLYQIVKQQLELDVPVKQLALKRDAAQLTSQQLTQWLRAEIVSILERPFDLSHGPLLRVELLKLADDDHVAVFAMHHIVSDGWSLSILVQEFVQLYEAFSQGQPSPLDALPCQYADYAAWQQTHANDQHLNEQLAFWDKTLRGTAELDLPRDDLDLPSTPLNGATLTADCSPALWQQLQRLSREQRVTPFMTLLAALQILLARLSGQTDFAIGTPIAGRHLAEIEPLIGCFLNTLALRADVSGHPSFVELLGKVRETTANAFANSDLPFERVVNSLQPSRDGTRTPIFQVLLNFLNYPSSKFQVRDLSIETLTLEEPSTKFDLTLYAQAGTDGLQLRLLYNRELFSEARMRLLLEQFDFLLQQIVSAPQACIDDYSLNSAGSRRMTPDPTVALLAPFQTPITETIRAWVERQPDRLAICCSDGDWSYGELWERATDLAQRLLDADLQLEQVVAVRGEKCRGLVAAMLAVELAGGVLLTLDPNLPRERHAKMLEESQAAWLIDVGLGDSLEPDLAGMTSRGCWRADRLGQILTVAPTAALGPRNGNDVRPPKLDGTTAAYLFFTSGSTGKPKGILGTHQGLAHFLAWQREQFHIVPQDRVGQLTALSFDVVLRDVFLPLTSGATLCLPTAEHLATGRDLLAWLKEQRITVIHSVPSLLRLWFGGLTTETGAERLRWIFSAGEPLVDSLIQQCRRVFSRASFVNLYGPTETTLAKCFHVVADQPKPGVQPVGRPLPQTQALVLDHQDRLCGVGEPGEIVIRTPFRTRGYIQSRQPTSQSFFVSPFTGDAHDVLYRTGDGGRWNPRGELEILGRLDEQVKINGVRVEPAEIAATLETHADLAAVAVNAFRQADGQYSLVAYFVPQPPVDLGEQPATWPERLRSFLRARLPAAFVPQFFVVVAEIPLLPNGKLDRRRLPIPSEQTIERPPHIEPTTEVEKTLAAIWQDLLSLEQVGVDDDFFAAGGHSLLATRVITRISQQLSVTLPLRTIFETPTIRGLAELIEKLRMDRSSVAPPPIARQARESDLPLALTQEALWFLDRLDPESGTYTSFPALRIYGELDSDLLRRALDAVIERHETLRTIYPEEGGRPVQFILPRPAAPPLHYLDISHLPEPARQQQLEEYVRQATENPVDLTRGPIARLHLLRLQTHEHVAILCWHHIIQDGWSLGVLVRELTSHYRAARDGQPAGLPELEIQYADWSVWQRAWLSGTRLEQLRSYWKKQLDGTPILNLPTDFPRPAMRSTRGQTLPLELTSAQSASLRQFCLKHAVTPFMSLLAAFQLTLSQFSSQDDIAVGTPVANRDRPETESLIGYFINMLVLRTRLSGEESFAQLVHRVRDTVLDAFEHQALTLDQVVDAVNPPRDPSRHPLFQAMFVLHNNAPVSLEELGLTAQPLEQSRPRASYFDLSLVLQDAEGRFQGGLTYNRDLFTSDTMQRLADHFLHLLTRVLDEPLAPLCTLPLLDEAQSQLIMSWNNTWQDCSQACVHQLFEARVAKDPQAVAVAQGDTQMSYDELNRRANQLAHWMRTQGVAFGEPVAVRLTRSPEMIVALLAVLKSGAGYLPLDPALPVERAQSYLSDAQVRWLVSEQTLARDLLQTEAWSQPQMQPLLIDDSQAQIEQQPINNPEHQVDSSSLAYMIYTSGSTGRPKGVMIHHAALSNYAQAAAVRYGISSEDRILQFTSYSYDGHVEELYPALVQGATIVLRTDETLASLQRFTQDVEQQAISVLSLPTGFWHEWVAELTAGLQRPGTLRTTIIGGEAVDRAAVEKWFALDGENSSLLNTYGPTETTVVATAAELSPSDGYHERPPIGRPLTNMRVHVLDRYQRLVPIGVEGELYIGGASVALGYFGQADLTGQRFVPEAGCRTTHHTQDQAAYAGSHREQQLALDRSQPELARMYRTGDVVRWRADGQLEFVGRTDHQVKLRGFRVEPGEIEALLREHLQVAEAAVVALRTQGGDLRLVAYLVTTGEAELAPAELRRFLASRVPDYMIPALFLFQSEMPHTTSGKVDRRALPAPDWNLLGEQGAYEPPRQGIEQRLARHWREVLEISQVGRQDDFFALGGNSLLALRLMSRVREEFSVDLPLARLFAAPQLMQLSAEIAVAPIVVQAEHSQLQPLPRLGPVPLSAGQQRFWFLDQLSPGNAAYNIHAALEVNGELDFKALQLALDEIVRRHEILRTRFLAEDGIPQQVIDSPSSVAIMADDLTALGSRQQAAALRQLAQQEATTAFDLSSGKLFRVRLVQLELNRQVLLVTSHHILFDAGSLPVLTHELAVLYDAFRTDSIPALRQPKLQYADYAAWQREWLQGERLSALQDYWTQQLRDVLAPDLPKDRKLLSSRRRGAAWHSRLSESQTQRMLEVCQTQSVTPYMLLLTAFKILLHKLCVQSDIAVATTYSGRHRKELERLIGFFVNTVILRSEIRGEQNFVELLSQVRGLVLAAIQQQDLPFDQVVETLRPSREHGRHPFTSVMFNMLSATESGGGRGSRPQPISIRGLELTETRHNPEFELVLTVREMAGVYEFIWSYDADLFDESTVARWSRHLTQLLDAVLEHPHGTLGGLSLLTERERQQLLFDWNQTASEQPALCMHQLFERQVERTPAGLAVDFEGRTQTYHELNVAANRIAHRLRELGVNRGGRVALLLERSLELPAAILGILKAGAAYVPVDTALPLERLRFMLDDCQPSVLLTTRHLGAAVAHAGPALLIDADLSLASQPTGNPKAQVQPTDPMYIIYTSGSTGEPKGTVMPHRGPVNRLFWEMNEFALDASDRTLLKTPLSFDVAAAEFFRPLAVGGQLIVARPDGHTDSQYWVELILAHQITALYLVPSTLRMLLSEDRFSECRSLRQVYCGGEQLPRELMDEFFRLSQSQLVNTYGPTETAISVAHWPCTRLTEGQPIPIGRPLANTRCYVLDSQRAPRR